MENKENAKGPREFVLMQFSKDGGPWSDIRVLRPSEAIVPSGHDNLNFEETLHVIEYSAHQSTLDELALAKEQLRVAVEAIKQVVSPTHYRDVLTDGAKEQVLREALAKIAQVGEG